MPTKDQVRQAMDDLEAAGAHVSPATIRQQLGGYGSYRDIVQHQKAIASEGPRPRRRATNGTQAASTALPPPPPPAPTPVTDPANERAPHAEPARQQYYRALALQRKAAKEEELEQLRVRAGRFMPMHEVREFNRQIVGTEREIEHLGRIIAQYNSELSRLR